MEVVVYILDILNSEDRLFVILLNLPRVAYQNGNVIRLLASPEGVYTYLSNWHVTWHHSTCDLSESFSYADTHT